MSDTGTPPLKCYVCGETKGLKRCGFCKERYYCSRDHQIKDWPDHKSFCQSKQKQTALSEKITAANVPVVIENNIEKLKRTTADLPDQSKEKNDESEEVDQNDKGEGSSAQTDTKKTKRKGKGIPFDTRPYLPVATTTVKTKSSDKYIAKLALETMNSQGYCVMDGLFTELVIDMVLQEIHSYEENGQFDSGKLAGGRTSGENDKKVVNAEIRCDTIVWVEGTADNIPGIRHVMAKLDRILTEFNELLNGKYFISNRTKAMLARYPGNGSYYKRHVDNPNKDGRVVTCILYLNKNWDAQKDGGILRILPPGGDSYIDVAPTANRLLFFWSDRRTPHEVHPAYRTRYTITVWYMDKEEREQAQLDRLQEEMANIRGSQQLLCLEEYLKKREQLSKQIEETTNRAIDSLTVEELAAIGAMIEDAPNPKEAMTALGIYPALQDKLLERLGQMKIATKLD